MRFAHIADCHLGAWQHNDQLRKMNLQAFLTAMSMCQEKEVDFVLIAGDLFHNPAPDFETVEVAVRKMRQLKDSGVEFYMILGSHDCNPNATSIADILDGTGFIRTLVNEERAGRVTLRPIQDPRTGTLIAGVSGRRKGEDAQDFRRLDASPVWGQEGLKILAFHNYVKGIASSELPGIPGISVEDLPTGFAYYAGGHAHNPLKRRVDHRGYGSIVFPGVLFGSRPRDLEETANGRRRGFFVVTAEDEQITDVEFCEVQTGRFVSESFDLEGFELQHARAFVQKRLEELDVDDAVVILRVRGRLSSGRPYELHFREIERSLIDAGATTVLIDRRGLTGELPEIARMQGTIGDIEEAELEAALRDCQFAVPSLNVPHGLVLAKELLRELGEEKPEGETRTAYEARLVERGKASVDREVL